MDDRTNTEPVVVGVDIGGTKMAVGLVDGRGRILASVAEPLEACEARPDTTIAQVARSIREVCRGAGLGAIPPVGIGIPAVVDREHGVVVWTQNIPGWRDLHLRRALSEHLETTRITLDFDGNTAVLGEGWIGAGQGRRNVAFLIIGTGIGAGMILDGRLYRGSSGIPGGVGWYALDPRQVPEAMSGRRASFEELCAGPALLRMANARVLGDERDGSEGYPDTHTLFASYDRGDRIALKVLKRAITYVGMAAANIISTLNPEVLVIGGGIGLQYCRRPNLFAEIRRLVSGLAQPTAAQVGEIRPASLGADAGIVGAAKLALDDFSLGR